MSLNNNAIDAYSEERLKYVIFSLVSIFIAITTLVRGNPRLMVYVSLIVEMIVSCVLVYFILKNRCRVYWNDRILYIPNKIRVDWVFNGYAMIMFVISLCAFVKANSVIFLGACLFLIFILDILCYFLSKICGVRCVVDEITNIDIIANPSKVLIHDNCRMIEVVCLNNVYSFVINVNDIEKISMNIFQELQNKLNLRG